jgi:preprotein translocase subunit SecF
MQIVSSTNYNFLRWRWHALALSAVLIVAGLATVLRTGLPLGIDFSGGTAIVLKFEKPVSEQAILDALGDVGGEKVVQRYGEPADNERLIRLPELVTEQGASLEQGARGVVERLKSANLGNFEVRSTEIVGPVIGRDLQRKGILATLASIVGITAYIAVRFRFTFAVGAIVATLHDILVTLAFLKFFGYELSLNIVAALLTITGYSVNDTIVVFDRVRENLRSMRRDALEHVVNLSVNQTLGRTIITAGTTFLTVLSLYLFGGEVLEGFAFAMIVGIVSGTYSTVFIAAAIAIIWQGKKPMKGQAAPAAQPSERKRRARAS